METIHTILTNMEHIRNILVAMPERKLAPFAMLMPIVFFGTMFLWNYIQWYFSNEKTN